MANIVKETVREVNGELVRSECSNFYNDMSKVEDMNYFSQIFEIKNDEEKQKIEEGIIYLSTLVEKNELKEYEVIFLEKYHKYLITTLEKDVREYYNNKYCKYLYFGIWNSITTEQQSQEIKFINGKPMEEIDIVLTDKYNKLIENMKSGIVLADNDKKFIEETFLGMAFNNIIYKECDGEKDLMYDIVEFFKKYPNNDISNSRNRQLDMLSVLSSKMIEKSYNCAILFDMDYEDLGNNNISLAHFSKTRSGIPYIKVNDLGDIYSEQNYLKKMFTIFHELGHLEQENDEFNDEFKKVIEMEHYLIKNDRAFYHKYHDSFCLEWDADNYATTQLIEKYGEQHPKLVTDIVEKKTNKKKIDWATFYLMELEEYGKICQQEQTKLRN